MEYRCISADCHIDLSWMPYDLFVSNASQKLKDRMPYVTQTDEGPKWVTKSGLDLGFANGKGGTGAWGGGGFKYNAGKHSARVERMAAMGLYSDGVAGKFRPTTPELRLLDQERDGVQAEVIYGLLGTGNILTDSEATVAFFRIYNDWLVNFCSYDRKRFVGLASIPSSDVDEAVKEIHRVAKLGLGGLDLALKHGMVPFWNPHWDPVWRAAAEVDLPVHFHTIGPPPEPPPPPELSAVDKLAARACRTAVFQLHAANILAQILHCGALERYAKLRIVLGESGIGWIAYVLERMDHEWESRYKSLSLKMKPSAYWRRQCRATFQDDRIGVKLIDDLGIETLMWGSDYPHSDGVFPDSQEYIQRQFGHLPETVQHKVTCENAGKFYRLIPS